MQRLYIGSTTVLSTLMVVLGLALIGSTIARGAGATALGILVGAGLLVGGAGRLWLLRGARDESR
jgi:hypothetical protein